jgi:carboxylate-amine ligase
MRTVGVEEEFLLVQRDSPLLAPEGARVIAAAEAADSTGQFEQEFKQEQAELGTAPHSDLAALRRELATRRAELAAAAEAQGVRLVASATSPVDQQVSSTVNDRYARMSATFGSLAHHHLTCGMHVHVAIESPEEGVAVLDRIRGWLPMLTALSANSPFFGGQDTEYASYRTLAWGQWPTAGTSEPFGTVDKYEQARADLVTSGAALDDGMIYFDARLSARYPTIEVRVCDVVADVRDAATIAGLIRAIVSTAAEQAAAGRPAPAIRTELLRAATWRAARWGMEEDLFDPAAGRLVPAWELVDRLVDEIVPALRVTSDEEIVRDGLARIRARGTGARLQREAYAEGGFDALIDVLVASTTAGAAS